MTDLFLKAVEKAGTTEVDAVRKAMYGMKVPNLTGGIAEMLPNHHLSKPVLIGEILDYLFIEIRFRNVV